LIICKIRSPIPNEIKMKPVIVLIIGLFFGVATAQQPQESDMPVTKDLINAYRDYFKDYDPLAPESVRKARFNKIVDKENPNLSEADRQRAFKIVDAYIRADKGYPVDYQIPEKDKKEIENMLNDAEQKKATGMDAMLGETERFKNMSYSEYKAFVTQNGQIPLSESDIQNAYNKLHKNDGRQVKISPQSTQPMNYVQAIDILRNPKKHTYSEFNAAMRFIKPEVTEAEIKEAWKKAKN